MVMRRIVSAIADRLGPSRASLEAVYARPQSRFIEVDGVRVHCMDEGPRDALAVVVLSSQWTSIDQWDGWSAALRDRYRFVRIELPGQGLTGPFPDGDYAMPRYRALVETALDRLGIGRLVLTGTSFSGPVAFGIAAAAGERLVGLILANASGMPRLPGSPTPNTPAPTAWLRWCSRYWQGRSFFAWKLAELLRDKKRITPELIREYADFNTIRGRVKESAARNAAYESSSHLAMLAQIRVPTLILWSGHSPYLPITDAARYREALTRAPSQIRIYDDVGHLIVQDAPERTGRDVRAFVDGVVQR